MQSLGARRPLGVRRLRAVAAVALAVGLLIGAAPAGAHVSSYCGHGTSGIQKLTVFEAHHYWQPTFHQYSHWALVPGGGWVKMHADEYRFCSDHH